ncbi:MULTISPECIES: ThuA domain-containing protein [Bacillaceae]|uniref:ThuA domain-containing protein n=1 Tax=Evansella alkalicola TaxID=745819 RepID=A0ABS6JZX1_9BACI|nr:MULTISPECIES: ThuA domain-containing protein [Bacillaceae]MBU9722757.1 ThuA domain-containing protein [Bacillus alkalicola]
MVKIVALLGDFYHDEDAYKVGLEAAIDRLPNKEDVELRYITTDEVGAALAEKPDLFVNGKMDPQKPEEEDVQAWLTDDLDKTIVAYVENGGSVLSWHSGMAGYDPECRYIKMCRGYFDYHPPGLQDVTYMLKEDEKTGPNTFPLKDEQYFVHCDVNATEVYLWSTGVDGDSLAGWKHSFGRGKVCCFTPAHTEEAMLDKNVSELLAEKIQWLL